MRIISVIEETPATVLRRLKFANYALIRWLVFWRDQFRCVYCGSGSLYEKVTLNLDHVTPKSRDGDLDFDNLVTACTTCNRGKSSTPLPSDIHTLVTKLVRKNNQRLSDALADENPELMKRVDQFYLNRRKQVSMEWKGENYRIREWVCEPGGWITLTSITTRANVQVGFLPTVRRISGRPEPFNECLILMDYLKSQGLKPEDFD